MPVYSLDKLTQIAGRLGDDEERRFNHLDVKRTEEARDRMRELRRLADEKVGGRIEQRLGDEGSSSSLGLQSLLRSERETIIRFLGEPLDQVQIGFADDQMEKFWDSVLDDGAAPEKLKGWWEHLGVSRLLTKLSAIVRSGSADGLTQRDFQTLEKIDAALKEQLEKDTEFNKALNHLMWSAEFCESARSLNDSLVGKELNDTRLMDASETSVGAVKRLERTVEEAKKRGLASVEIECSTEVARAASEYYNLHNSQKVRASILEVVCVAADKLEKQMAAPEAKPLAVTAVANELAADPYDHTPPTL